MTSFTQTDINDLNGSHLQGVVRAGYHALVSVFGEPTRFDNDDKVTVEWAIEFDDGTVASIYDWKEWVEAEAVTQWHVGGFSPKAVARVEEALA